MVREHYLRDDIWSGSPLDPESDPISNKLAADAKEYLVVDTNVVLQQVCVCGSLPVPLVLLLSANPHFAHPLCPSPQCLCLTCHKMSPRCML